MKKGSGIARSRPEVFIKKSVLENSGKFAGKHLYQRPFFNEVAGLSLQPIEKKTATHVFLWILRITTVWLSLPYLTKSEILCE